MSKSKMRGLDWFPISSRSLNPRVTSRACCAPLRSKRALVPTVVDSRMTSILSVESLSERGIGWARTWERMRRTHSVGASE